MKKILVASDLTQGSIPALRTALELARQLDAVVTVVHVVAPPYDEGSLLTTLTAGDREYLRALSERERRAALSVLDEQVKQALDELGPTPAATRVQIGSPADGILAAAAETGADMIVLGTHGRTGWQHFVLGSIAERVVRRSPVPVLTMRAAHGQGLG